MEIRVLSGHQGLKKWDEVAVVSTPPIPEPYTHYPSAYYMLIFCKNFVIPVVIFTGIVGNILAFIVFVFSSLKRLPTSVYLAALALADCSFLICLGVGWLDNFRFSFFQQEVVCTCLVYMTYVFSFLSVWFVVCFTTDMYLTLFHERLAAKISHVSKARFVVCTVTLVSTCIYLHTFWTTKQVKAAEDQETCMFVADEEIRIALALLDSFLTLILPFSLLIFMNTRILLVIVGFSKRRQPKEQQQDQHQQNEEDDAEASASNVEGLQRLEPIEEVVEEADPNLQAASASSAGGRRSSSCCKVLRGPQAREQPGEDACSLDGAETEITSASSDAQDVVSTKNHVEDEGKQGARCSSSTRSARGGRKKSSDDAHKNSSKDTETEADQNRSSTCEEPISFYETDDLKECHFDTDGVFIDFARNKTMKYKTVPGKISEMQRKSFKMLLTVAGVFLLLNLPSHAIRLQGLLRSFFTPDYVTSEVEHICQEFFQVLYYFNFTANFIIYNACAKSFRTAIVTLPLVLSKACSGRRTFREKSRKCILTTHRIGEELRRMREEQNSRLVEVDLAELRISKIESFASDYKYESPPCLLRRSQSQTDEETRA